MPFYLVAREKEGRRTTTRARTGTRASLLFEKFLSGEERGELESTVARKGESLGPVEKFTVKRVIY